MSGPLWKQLDFSALGAYLKRSLPIVTDAEFYQSMQEARALYESENWEVVWPVTQNITDPPIANPMQYIDTDDETKVAAFKHINDMAYEMYECILSLCPRSAERTLAIRKLQEARMWANAAVVFDGRTYKT